MLDAYNIANLPAAHILMPVYNAEKFIINAITSALDQTYPKIKIFLEDDSDDKTLETLNRYLEERPAAKNKIHIQHNEKSEGISKARKKLWQRSKEMDPNAFIFWLDSDDIYTDRDAINSVINQMQQTKAEICIINFSITYEDDKAIANAQGLIKDKALTEKRLREIHSHPNKKLSPDEFNALEITSLGQMKCYSPTAIWPEALDYPFEDFVPMASLLFAKSITTLDPARTPYQYLRRSTSICGQRLPENFTIHIPSQLKRFFEVVLENTSNPKKLLVAKEFVERKLAQYTSTLQNIVKNQSYPNITQATFDVYTKVADELRAEISGLFNPEASTSFTK